MDAEAVNQIVKAIMSLHDGRVWKPETIFSAVAAVAAAGAATAAFILGTRQIESAQNIAQQQIDTAEKNAQRQIDSAHAVAKQQVESAQEMAKRQAASAMAVAQEQIESAHAVARLNLATTMRQAWGTQFRGRLASFLAQCVYIHRHPNMPEEKEFSLTMATLGFELSLLLDPMENMHRVLNEALQKVSLAAALDPRDKNAFEQATQEVRAAAHFVMKG